MPFRLITADAKDGLVSLPNNSVHLIMTSPPYVDQRKDMYESISPDKYVEWFSPIAKELLRVLDDRGSFILNIKERTVAGEKHTYVIDLIKELKRLGWRWTEDYIWHKRNCSPGKWPDRFRDAWEHLLHFTKSKDFKMNQDAVMVPVGDWALRLPKESVSSHRQISSTGSGFGATRPNINRRSTVYPSNVLYLPTESSNVGHPAAFPVELPNWFVRLLTDRGDMVLDPFSGSGTTGVAALSLLRDYIGIEVKAEYNAIAAKRLEPLTGHLLDIED